VEAGYRLESQVKTNENRKANPVQSADCREGIYIFSGSQKVHLI
jgi:hypothetical protein